MKSLLFHGIPSLTFRELIVLEEDIPTSLDFSSGRRLMESKLRYLVESMFPTQPSKKVEPCKSLRGVKCLEDTKSPNNKNSKSQDPPTSSSSSSQGTLSKIYNFEKWHDPTFLAMFILAAFMGSVLNYSIFLCTTLNSALTTAVVGALKNVAVTYIGMVLFEDYAFSWVNFIGINISIAGSLYYTYITIFKGVRGFGNG